MRQTGPAEANRSCQAGPHGSVKENGIDTPVISQVFYLCAPWKGGAAQQVRILPG